MPRRALQPVFLVSTGRTGTRFFAGFFQEITENIAAHHTSSYTRLVNIVGSMRYLGLAPTAVSRALWYHLKVSAIQGEPRRYIECNPYYWNFLDLIWESFPEARIVHLIRHPHTFIQSHIRWERQRWQSQIANQLVPFWGPVGYHEQLLGLGGNTHQRVRYYAKVWRRKNETILRTIDSDPRATTFRFEDVFAPDAGTRHLAKLVDWLGLVPIRPIGKDVLSLKRNETAARSFHWNAQCNALIRWECGTLMERFGYDD